MAINQKKYLIITNIEKSFHRESDHSLSCIVWQNEKKPKIFSWSHKTAGFSVAIDIPDIHRLNEGTWEEEGDKV